MRNTLALTALVLLTIAPPANALTFNGIPVGAICPANYAPVCGIDGKTYGNKCEADSNKIAITKNGACDDSFLYRVVPGKNPDLLVRPLPVRSNAGDERARTAIVRAATLLDSVVTRAEVMVTKLEKRYPTSTALVSAREKIMQALVLLDALDPTSATARGDIHAINVLFHNALASIRAAQRVR